MINTNVIATPDRCEYFNALGLRLIFTGMNPVSRGSGLEAWVMVRWTGTVPDPKPLTFGTYNLKGARTVSTLATEICAADTKLDKEAVREAVGEAVLDVINVFFEQHDAAALVDVDDAIASRWLLRPLLEMAGITRLIAPGGSLKSAFGLALCITVAANTRKLLGVMPTESGPCLILDWETDASTTAERIRALCQGAGIPVPENVFYMRMSGSLYLAQRRILAAIAELKPVLIVVDSNAMARGATGEGGAEDSTIRMITALRSFGCAAFVIDHKSDEKIRRGISGGYGSIYNRNLARLEWEIVRHARVDRTTSMVMRLEKANNIRTKRELGFAFTIDTDQDDRWDSVVCEPIDPSTVLGLPSTAANTNADKIRHWLSTQSEAQLVASVAMATKLSVASVRTTLARYSSIFENTTPESPKGHWRVAGQETDEGTAEVLPDTF